MESNNPTETTTVNQPIHWFDSLQQQLSTQFGDALLSFELQYDYPVFEVKKEKCHEILAQLKRVHGFNFLTTLCGIHFPDNETEKEFAMMYQLHNLYKNERIRIRTFMPKSDLNIPTITDIWAAANWLERETYDFFGFNFVGHPDLRRILNMDEMNYYPLRKEYPLEDGTRHDKEDKYFGR